MLDKLLLNNQILANKKKVQQAKVNVITKLVHKIRKLKKASAHKSEDTKIKKKIARTVDVLVCLKRLKSFDVLKKSIVNDKSPTAVITNGNSTPEDVAHALLFAHRSVSETTKKVKEICHLNENTDFGWRDEILESSKKKKKLLRTGNKKKKREEQKEYKSFGKKRNEWLEQNSLSDTKQKTGINSDSNNDEWKVSVKIASKPTENLHRPENFNDPIDQINTSANIKFNKSSENQDLSIRKATQPTHAVDPFFVTRTGENYLSNAVINRTQAEISNDGLVRRERRAELFGTVGKRSKFRKNNEFTERTRAKHNYELKDKRQQNVSLERNKEDLHPSWALKQKQTRIQEFQGKRVKFDNDGNNEAMANITTKKVPGDDPSKEKLHPSWEAKQKMKPKIADFKGTKIVFEDH